MVGEEVGMGVERRTRRPRCARRVVYRYVLRAREPLVELLLLEFRKLRLEVLLEISSEWRSVPETPTPPHGSSIKGECGVGRTSSSSTPVYAADEMVSETSFASCICS